MTQLAITAKDLYALLDKADEHARAITALHTQLRAMLTKMDFPQADVESFRCRSCGNTYATERALALHAQNVHGGPVVPLDPHEEAA